MSKKLTNKFLLLAIVFVMLASVLFVSVLTNNTKAFAEDEDEIVEYQEEICTYSCYFNAFGRTTVVDLTNISKNTPRIDMTILDTVENIYFFDGGKNTKLMDTQIRIDPRTKDLNVYIDGFDIGGDDNHVVIYNKSTKGTVNFINNGTDPVVISGGTRTDSSNLDEGMGIYGIVYSKSNISFSGEAGFVIDGAGYITSTSYRGNLMYGNTGLQISGSKNVYINTTVNIIGGNGKSGAYIPSLIGFDGGHGGYAFDGSSAQIIIGDEGYLTLKGGHGGNGACQPKRGTLGAAGKGCAAYKGSIHVNDTSKFEYEAGEDGIPGYYYSK